MPSFVISYGVNKGAHYCSGRTNWSGHGEAISSCDEDTEGRFWVSNDEYASQVAFCPYCGKKAPTQPEQGN